MVLDHYYQMFVIRQCPGIQGSLDLLLCSSRAGSLAIAVPEKRGVEGDLVLDVDSPVHKPRCHETEAQVVALLIPVPPEYVLSGGGEQLHHLRIVEELVDTVNRGRRTLQGFDWEEVSPFFIFTLL